MSPSERLLAGAFLFLFALLLGLETLSGHERARLTILFAVLSWAPLLVIHELGHLTVARLVGFRVSELVIGQGPPLLRTRVAGTRVVLRTVPVSGYVQPYSQDGRRARLAMALTYAAGPAAELLMVGLLFAVLGEQLWAPSDHLGVLAAQSFAVAAVLGAVINLIPLPAGESVTDGLGMVLSFSLDQETFERLAESSPVEEADIALDDDRPADALSLIRSARNNLPQSLTLKVNEAVCLAAMGDDEAALALLSEVRDLPTVPRAVEAESLHAAARVVLELGDSGLLTQALEGCRAAIRMAGPRAPFLITLARLQLALGQAAQAEESLMVAFKQTKEPYREDRCLCYLAVAYAELGARDLSQRCLSSLSARRPGRRLLREAESGCRAAGRAEELGST